MDSLYGKYIKEKAGDEIIETDKGFASYRFMPDGACWIMDIYVEPQWRQENVASVMADIIVEKARSKGCTELLGTAVPSLLNSTAGLKVMLAYGMTLKSATQDLIILRKDI